MSTSFLYHGFGINGYNIFGLFTEKEKLFSALFKKLFHCIARFVEANDEFKYLSVLLPWPIVTPS